MRFSQQILTDYFSRAKILKECGSFDLEDLSASVPNIDTSAEIKGICNHYWSQYLSDKMCKMLFSCSKSGAADVCRTVEKIGSFLSL